MRELFSVGNMNEARRAKGANLVAYLPVRGIERFVTILGWAVEGQLGLGKLGSDAQKVPFFNGIVGALRHRMAVLRGEPLAAAFNAGKFEQIYLNRKGRQN